MRVALRGSASQQQLHRPALFVHAERFIKPHGAFVERPDVERHVVAPAVFGCLHNVGHQRLADAVAATCFVDAKVVHIQRFAVFEQLVIFDFFQNATLSGPN